jgi:hypothetical protein
MILDIEERYQIGDENRSDDRLGHTGVWSRPPYTPAVTPTSEAGPFLSMDN